MREARPNQGRQTDPANYGSHRLSLPEQLQGDLTELIKFIASFCLILLGDTGTEADSTVFEMCHDSSGNTGDGFRCDAKELFVGFASRCPGKDKIADIILKVNQKDKHGIRDTLIAVPWNVRLKSLSTPYPGGNRT